MARHGEEVVKFTTSLLLAWVLLINAQLQVNFMRTPVFVVVAIAIVGCASNSRFITAKDFGDAYPFTVDGYLECEAPGAVILKANGVIYPINGTAEAKYRQIGKPLSQIWKDDPKVPGTKMSVDSVISEGQKLCN